jgi:hypothetical protein
MNRIDEPAKRWHDIAVKIAMVFVSLIVGLVLLEVALRLLGYKPHRPIDALYERNSELGYSLTGSTCQVMETSEARYLVTISDGRRNIPDQTCTPRDATTSVYAVGDSFCFGQAVDDKNVWINYLASSIGKSHKLYLYNLGVPGYSPEQYHLMIEKLPQDLGKAVVIYFFFMGNDIMDWALEDFKKNASKMEFRPNNLKLLRWISYHSAAVWSVCAMVVAYQNRHKIIDFFKSEAEFESFKQRYPNWHTTVALVSDSLKTVKRRGGKMLLVVIPNGRQYFDQKLEAVARYVGNSFSRDIKNRVGNVAVLDLSQHMHSGHQFMFEGLGHFNVRGNQWMAGLIEPMLIGILKQ